MKELETKLGYCFCNRSLLSEALNHSSYANEKHIEKYDNNERIEFLGDAVLELVISDYIYKLFPHMPEGELTKLRAGTVCEGSLAERARIIGLSEFLMLGRGEEATGGRKRDSILADAFEKVLDLAKKRSFLGLVALSLGCGVNRFFVCHL